MLCVVYLVLGGVGSGGFVYCFGVVVLVVG